MRQLPRLVGCAGVYPRGVGGPGGRAVVRMARDRDADERGLFVVMRRCCVVLALLAMVIGGLSALPAQAVDKDWVPPAGVSFNEPRGGPKARTKLVRRVIAGIKNARKGSTIRFAMYSFDRRDVANALLKAHRRGVNVQLIVNDNWTSYQTVRLRRELGTKPRKKSFYVICKGACRGGKGNLHMKVYAFSETGAATKVIMTGSANLTNRAVSLQWNDQVTLLDQPGLYDAFLEIFRELKFDKRVSPRRLTYEGGESFDALFYREVDPNSTINSALQPRLPTPSEDPVMRRLRLIDCDAESGFGLQGKTKIRIMMYGWNKDRGVYLAKRIAELKREGCDIAVITSVAGGKVVKILNRARIPIKSADYDYQTDLITEEETVNFYSHLKVLTVNGTYGGKSVRTVWTGSENWSGTSFLNDELIIHMTSDKVYEKYLDRYRKLWNRFTHPVGVHPENLPVP